MTNSFIAIRGIHLDRMREIFEIFNYKDTHQDKQFNDWQEFNDFLYDNYFELASNNLALRGIWSDNGWTIIIDPEMVDTTDEEVLLELSKKLDTDIITFIIQTTSNSFGFTLYNDSVKRKFVVSDGEVTDNLHQPLEQEKGLNINKKIFSDDILNLAENFGIDLKGNGNRTYLVKQLGYSEEMIYKLEEFKQNNKQLEKDNKPWWKIW